MREEVERAYEAVIHESLSGFDKELMGLSEADLVEFRQEKEQAKQTLQPYLSSKDEFSSFKGWLDSLPSDMQPAAMTTFLDPTEELHQELIEKEAAIREVIDFITDGLSQDDDGELSVRYHYKLKLDDEETNDVEAIDSIPVVIGNHPNTEWHGTCFAAETAFRAARLLTPEVVELVLNDTTRELPTKVRLFSTDASEPLSETTEG